MDRNERQKQWKLDNPDKVIASRRRHAAKIKAEVLAVYGLSCVRCGFDDERALTIDHINNDGSVERLEKGAKFSGEKFYRDLRRRGFPSGYQTLCFNCNIIKFRETFDPQ